MFCPISSILPNYTILQTKLNRIFNITTFLNATKTTNLPKFPGFIFGFWFLVFRQVGNKTLFGHCPSPCCPLVRSYISIYLLLTSCYPLVHCKLGIFVTSFIFYFLCKRLEYIIESLDVPSAIPNELLLKHLIIITPLDVTW